MKTGTIIALAGSVLFTSIFYTQTDGVNFLVFSFFVVAATAMVHRQIWKNPRWWWVALCTIATGAAVAYYGNTLAWTANVFSLLLLAGISGSPLSSGFIAFFTSLVSMALTVVSLMKNTFSKLDERKAFELKTVGLLVLPMLVTTVFFFLYRTANPLFATITDRITLHFPTVGQILYTGVGFYVLYGCLHPFLLRWVLRADADAKNKLPYLCEEDHQQTLWSEFVSLETERKTALLLFTLLNLLLFCVNVIDVYYGFILGVLPEGLTLSEYLHDGTNALIVSIVFAALLVLTVFRGYLNFDERANTIRWLAYIWIAQNIVIIATTLNRNLIYINSYGLTHRRIGVFVFLILCAGGLLLTFVKVKNKLSNWFLLRSNWWMAYCFLIMGSFVNWDAIIFRHNMCLADEQNKAPDDYFLTSLSHTTTPAMLELYHEHTKTGRYAFTKRLEHNIFDRVRWSIEHVHYDEWPSQVFIHHLVVQKSKANKMYP